MLYDAHGNRLRRIPAFGFRPAPDVWVVAEPEPETDADAIAQTEIDEDPEEDLIQCH